MQDDDGRRHLKASSTVHSGKDVVIASNTQEREWPDVGRMLVEIYEENCHTTTTTNDSVKP